MHEDNEARMITELEMPHILSRSIVGNGLTELHPEMLVDQRGSLLLL